MRVLLLTMVLGLLFVVAGCSDDNGEIVYAPVGEPGYDYSVNDLDEDNQDINDVDLDSDVTADIVEVDIDTDDALESTATLETAVPNINLNEEGILVISAFDLSDQIQEIQEHRSAFLGLTIRYEGQFFVGDWGDETIYFVARIEAGCGCFYGFEVYLNDIPRFDAETWVEVTGILENFFLEDEERYILRLNVINMVEI
jgi:uncharacterized membrane protein YcgQ (UPF0703/DUF1980 family)